MSTYIRFLDLILLYPVLQCIHFEIVYLDSLLDSLMLDDYSV